MKTGHRKKVNINVVFVFMLILPVFLYVCLCFVSCNPKNTTNPESITSISFRKIYDRIDTSVYSALDVKETADGGYIILGIVEQSPYLLRVDENGDFLWDTEYGDLSGYKEPVSELLIPNQENQTYYFFCIEELADRLAPVLLMFSDTNETNNKPEESFELSFLNYRPGVTFKPIRASKISNEGFLLLASDNYGGKILVLKTGKNGVSFKEDEYESSTNCFYLYPPTDERYHITGVIENQDHYYFQTYKSTPENEKCFTSAMGPPGNEGYEPEVSLNRPFIAMKWHSSDQVSTKFAGARIDNSIITYFVNSTLQDVDEKEGRRQTEMDESKPVYVETIDVKGQKIAFFGATSRSNKMELYAYGVPKENWEGELEFDSKINYETAGLLKTSDGGIAVLGNTSVASRLGRICLFKLSKEEVEAIVAQE